LKLSHYPQVPKQGNALKQITAPERKNDPSAAGKIDI